MTALALKLRRNFEGWFWALWMTIAFLAFAFIAGRAIRGTNLGEVPLKPCKTCMGCACPKLLGGPRCACPE